MSEFIPKPGQRVRVKGDEHPHHGRIGTVTEVLGVLVKIGGNPRAMIRLDDGGPNSGNFIVVSLKFLEAT